MFFERIIPLSPSMHTCLHIDIDTYAKKDTMCAFQMAATNAQKGNRVWPPIGPFAGRHARLQLQRTHNYLFRTSKSPRSVEVQARKKSNIPFCQTESVNIFEDTAFSKSQASALPSAGTVVLNEGIVSLHHLTSYHS